MHITSEQTARRSQENTYFSCSRWAERMSPFFDAIAEADIPVLIQGETGVGKEVMARRLHECSPRASGPFVKLNCAAMPAELIESELFGYERGAFTGAFASTPGKFELAQDGVLLLDEIGDMDVRLQAKLLQVLQDQQFYRLGAKVSSKVNVRVFAATHCDLETAILQKRFREDLYYRLNVASITIPPLRERSEEILLLAEFFLRKHSMPNRPRPELTPNLRQALQAYQWPGNVRELENLMRKYIVMPTAELIIEDLQGRSQRRSEAQAAEPVNAPDTGPSDSGSPGPGRSIEGGGAANYTMAQIDQFKREAEAEAIVAALEAARWNRKRAAAMLEVDYKVFLYRMKRLGISQ